MALGSEETRILMEQVKNMNAADKSTFMTWLVVSLIRDISYYVVLAILVFSLGRRLIQACLSAFREASRANG
ncbi:MAG TPA: hypothetical protein VF669_10200 [Tepidisphaeraceae bacterium]|jgi:hypothetical protein